MFSQNIFFFFIIYILFFKKLFREVLPKFQNIKIFYFGGRAKMKTEMKLTTMVALRGSDEILGLSTFGDKNFHSKIASCVCELVRMTTSF